MASATTGLAAIAGMAGLATLASAAATETPTISAVVYSSAGTAVTSAVVGTSLHAVATVASSTASTSPTGTVDFNVYSNTSCTGSPVAQTGLSLVLGQATSSNTVLPIGGLSYKVHYSGQGDLYTSGDSACKPVSATQSGTAINLSLSNTNVQAGSYVYAIPNLTGETASADGTVQYRVYSNNTCSTLALNAGDKTVTNSSTPNSDSWQFITPGTYYWQVGYSGDVDNSAATSSCAAAGTVLTVVATSSTPTTTPATPGTISGTVFNDLNKNDKQDSGEAGLSGWTVWLHKQATTTNKWLNWFKKHDLYNDPIVATVTTDANGNYSFGNLGNGTYFVEEKVMTGWKQTSDDTKVVLNASKTSADVDFSNIAKNATTTKDHNDKGNKDNKDTNGKDNGKDKGDKNGDQAKANGWFQYTGNIPSIGNVFGWLHLSMK